MLCTQFNFGILSVHCALDAPSNDGVHLQWVLILGRIPALSLSPFRMAFSCITASSVTVPPGAHAHVHGR